MSDSRLAGLLPEMREKEQKLRNYASSRGIAYVIADYGGLRTQADTVKLVGWRDAAVAKARKLAALEADKRRLSPSQKALAVEQAGKRAYYRVSPFGRTFHSRGAAFDIRITTTAPGLTFAQSYKVLGDYAPQIGLRWGGNFSAPADPFHFEDRRTLEELDRRFAEHQAQLSSGRAATLGAVTPVVIVVAVVVLGASLLGGLEA